MPQLAVFASGFMQVGQTIGTGDDLAVYRVMFDILPPQSKDPIRGCSCSAKCTAGAVGSPLEVSYPRLPNGEAYQGAWNQLEFADVINKYIAAGMRQMFGFGPGAANVTMVHNLIGFPGRLLINVPGTPLGGIW